MRLDSIARVRRADSLAEAERAGRVPPAPSRWRRSAATRRSCGHPGARPRRHRRPGPRTPPARTPPSRHARARSTADRRHERRPREPAPTGAGAGRPGAAALLRPPAPLEPAGEPGLPAHGAGAVLHAGGAGRGARWRGSWSGWWPTRSPRRGSARARWRTRSWATWSPGAARSSSPTTCCVNAGFVAAALWLRDLVLLVASGTDHSPLLAEVTLYSPLAGAHTALFALLVARRVPRVVRHPAGRYERLRLLPGPGTRRHRPGGAGRRVPGARGRVLPDPGHPAREVPAPGRDQPAPADSAHRRLGARSSTATGEIIAENVPGYSVKVLAPSADSLRAVLLRIARFVPLDTARRGRGRPALRGRRATSRRWCSATPTSRPSPGSRSTARCCRGW